MATAQFKNDTGNNISSIKPVVFIKTTWDGEWRCEDKFQVLRINEVAAPAMSTATIKVQYGKGTWEDLSEMVNGTSLVGYNYCYVQVRGYIGNSEIVLFTGVIPVEKFQLLGQHNANKTACQIIQADGLDSLLNTRLNFAKTLRRDSEIVDIEWLPVFNQRHQFGGAVTGNRCEYSQAVDRGDGTMINIYLFGGEEVWNNFQIAQYLLTCHQKNNIPQFRISQSSKVLDALAQVVGVYDFSTMTLRAALNALMSRARGFGWKYKVKEDNTIELIPFSMLDIPIKLGNVEMPANSNAVDVSEDIWTDQVQTKTEIIADTSSIYSKIIVRGSRIKSCCTVKYSDGTLEKAWTDSGDDNEEQLYKDAAKLNDGYGDLDLIEKGEINDPYRTSDKFAKVFANFRIPPDWDWLIPNGSSYRTVNPYLNDKGEMPTGTFSSDGKTTDVQQANYYNRDKRILPFIPLKEGYDYEDDDAVDNNKDNTEPEFRRMFVLAKDGEGHYRYVEKNEPGAYVRVLDREMGLEIKFTPQYFAAANNFSDAEPAIYSTNFIDRKGVDYTDYIATVFLETDVYFSLYEKIQLSENEKTLIIDIPDAEYWYVTPGTVVDINAEGELVTFGCNDNAIRNDIDMLKTAMAAAIAWYGRQHNKAVITFNSTVVGFEIGTLVTGIGLTGKSAGSVVTCRSWSFEGNTETKIQTDHAELDIAAAIASIGTISTPTIKTAARKIDKIDHEIKEVKSQINKAPVRQTTGGSVAEAAELLYLKCEVIEAPVDPSGDDPTGQAYYTLRPSTASYDEWEDDYSGGYSAGAFVVDPDTNLLYESEEDDNTDALTEESWSLQEECRVTKVWGYQWSGDYDIRNFVPVFQVGDEVEVFSITSGETTTYYLQGTFTHVGAADIRTIVTMQDDNDNNYITAVFA